MDSNNYEKIITPNIDNAIPLKKDDNNKDQPKTKSEIEMFEMLRREVTIHNQKLIIKDGVRL